MKSVSLTFLLMLASVLLAQRVSANETGWVNVLQVGGQSTSMFVVFSQTVGTDQTCPNSRLVLGSGVMDAESQKRFYSAMLTAMQTGTKVALSVSGCYDVNYPTMKYYDYWFAQS